MNVISKRKSSALRALHFGLLALMLCAAMPSAWARQHKPDPSQAVLVVAHVPFADKSSTDMALQTQANGNRYLYVEHSLEQGISILDITKASEPKLVGSVAWPDSATTHMAEVTGEAVLLTEGGANSTASQPATAPANDPLVLWDTSNPNSPKIVQRFAKVNRVLSDDRGYIYVLSADGLWVISTPTANQRGDPDAPQNFVEYGGGG